MIDYMFDFYVMFVMVIDCIWLIFVCNFNNLIFIVVGLDVLVCFVEVVLVYILIVIDEVYVEYIWDGMWFDSLGLVCVYNNVVVLCMFLKVYGLVGLWIGYVIGYFDVIIVLDKVYVLFIVLSIG